MKPAVMPGDIESTDDYQSVISATIRAETAADSAEQNAEIAQNVELHPVIVGTNGNYWNWDDTAGEYADSGVEAQSGPQGEPGPAGENAIAVDIQSGEYREPGSSKDLPDLPDFADTEEYYAYLVDDDDIEGQYDLYIHAAGGTDWMIIDNWAGVPGPAGADGIVQSVVAGSNITVNNSNPASPVISAIGNMTKSQYDPDNSVAEAGGIVPYVAGELEPLSTHSYSETLIGTWVDGKPLYRKVINFGNLPNNSVKSVAHGINNIGDVAILTGIAKHATNGSYMTLPNSSQSNPVTLSADATNVNSLTVSSLTSYVATAIITYTKTTD